MGKVKWDQTSCDEVERRWQAGETLAKIGESYGLCAESMRRVIHKGRRLARHAYYRSLPPVIDAATGKLRPQTMLEAPHYPGLQPFAPLKRQTDAE